MTDRAHDPYFDMQKTAEPEIDREGERGMHEDQLADPAGRKVPFVEGPTGAAPLSSELRGDPGDPGDQELREDRAKGDGDARQG
jgi:hypothetical protein